MGDVMGRGNFFMERPWEGGAKHQPLLEAARESSETQPGLTVHCIQLQKFFFLKDLFILLESQYLR